MYDETKKVRFYFSVISQQKHRLKYLFLPLSFHKKNISFIIPKLFVVFLPQIITYFPLSNLQYMQKFFLLDTHDYITKKKKKNMLTASQSNLKKKINRVFI